MTRALSTDLRQRTLAAVASGMSRRAAASRFGASPSSVIRWAAEWHASGRNHALRQGGDRRSHRIEAWSDFLLAAVEVKGDISLVELANRLATEHGSDFQHDGNPKTTPLGRIMLYIRPAKLSE